MTKKILFVVLLYFLSNFASAGEANFVIDKVQNRLYLSFDGPIQPGDTKKIISKIEREKYYFVHSKGFVINSPGGDVSEAILLAQLVERAAWRVDVMSNGICASACFLIYISAPARFSDGALIVHRPYFDMGKANGNTSFQYEQANLQAISAMKSYLSDRLVPNDLIDKMMTKGSSEGYVLTNSDMMRVGFFSPAMAEYLTQVCSFPSDNERHISIAEAKIYSRCWEKYMQDSRIKLLFGDNYSQAVIQFDALNKYIKDTIKFIPENTREHRELLESAKRAVDTMPPNKWISYVKSASQIAISDCREIRSGDSVVYSYVLDGARTFSAAKPAGCISVSSPNKKTP